MEIYKTVWERFVDMKHKYKIMINGSCKETEPINYQFGSTKNNKLMIRKQKASVSFEMSVKKTVADFTSLKVHLLKDAYRKMCLLHTIKFGEPLRIKRISIIIDEKEAELPVDILKLHSMLGKSKLELPESWKKHEFMTFIANFSKDSLQYDKRFAAMFSYLTSNCRSYESDRFTNLWTAMNACYGYISKCFIVRLMLQYNVKQYTDLHSELQFAGKDSKEIAHLMFLIGNGTIRPDTKKKHHQFHNLERQLSHLSYEEIIQLYDESFSLMNEKITEIAGRFQSINKCAEAIELPLFLILLLELPYYLRCKYLHGNVPMLMLAFESDTELGTLRVVNYFLTRFLGDVIPLMIGEDFLDEQKYLSLIGHLKSQQCYQKAFKRLEQS